MILSIDTTIRESILSIVSIDSIDSSSRAPFASSLAHAHITLPPPSIYPQQQQQQQQQQHAQGPSLRWRRSTRRGGRAQVHRARLGGRVGRLPTVEHRDLVDHAHRRAGGCRGREHPLATRLAAWSVRCLDQCRRWLGRWRHQGISCRSISRRSRCFDEQRWLIVVVVAAYACVRVSRARASSRASI